MSRSTIIGLILASVFYWLVAAYVVLRLLFDMLMMPPGTFDWSGGVLPAGVATTLFVLLYAAIAWRILRRPK